MESSIVGERSEYNGPKRNSCFGGKAKDDTEKICQAMMINRKTNALRIFTYVQKDEKVAASSFRLPHGKKLYTSSNHSE